MIITYIRYVLLKCNNQIDKIWNFVAIFKTNKKINLTF